MLGLAFVWVSIKEATATVSPAVGESSVEDGYVLGTDRLWTAVEGGGTVGFQRWRRQLN
jgi:hypothetical protein